MKPKRLSRRETLGLLGAGPVALGALAANAETATAAAVGQDSEEAGRILMPIGDATEVVDTLYPFFRVAEDGYKAVIAGPEARMYHMVTHEVPPSAKIPWDITEERPGYHIQAEVAFRDVDPTKFAGLFVSGGRAPEYLRYDKDLMRITRHFFEANKPVAVVCHGIEIVSAAGVIKGRTVTTVAKCALDCEQGGAKYVDRPVVVDGNLITARTWHDYGTFMKEFMKQVLAADKDKRRVAE
jgi:protease I